MVITLSKIKVGNKRGVMKKEAIIKEMPLNNLSAIGSTIFPYLDSACHFLAKNPSRASLRALIIKRFVAK